MLVKRMILNLHHQTDCGDNSQNRFTVIGSDPHGFDRNGDGEGCESKLEILT